ncbi:MAG TPA: hypothetical protein VGR28_10490 [Candidatus Thermoplasmatota archaeon]|nr:hypothetical protein [Candidatus Thermoplasmatota archaeon]
MRPLLLALLGVALFLMPAVPAPAPGLASLDCDPACNVRVTSVTGPANEVMVAVDPTDPNNLIAVAKDYNNAAGPACSAHNVWMGVYTSHDGGRTWANQLMPGYPGDDTLNLLSLFDCSSDPVVTFDGKGRALATGIGVKTAPTGDILASGIWVAQSFDKGATWPVQGIAAAGPSILHDKQWIVADPVTGGAFLGWAVITPIGAIPVMARSHDGIVWQPPLLPVNGFNTVPELEQGTGISFALGGPHPFANVADIYMTWVDGREITEALSIDGGGAWEHYEHVDTIVPISRPNTPYRTPNFPSTAVAPAIGFNFAVHFTSWADQRFGSPDIVVTNSTDNGHHPFGPAVRITDDPPGPNVQFFPVLATGPDGCIHALWYDRRDDPGNYKNGVYYSRSCDGWGDVWSPNLKVADPSDPAPSFHQDGQMFIGDYIGLTVGSDNVAHAVWTDTRNGRADVYTARILP